jgi:GNAT superfamily N-acetyltransferase
MTRRVPVTISHLELPSPAALRPSTATAEGMELRRELSPDAAKIAAEMYRRVGGAWNWRDRLPWTSADWAHEIDRDEVEVWTLTEQKLTIGYFELESHADAVEVKYFGLTEAGMGRGLWGWLLTKAVERAWAKGASRVILNTCTLDGPAALPNYLARGFRLVRVEHQERELPE